MAQARTGASGGTRARVAVNGFGRIGRLVFRQLMELGEVEVIAVNDIAPLDNLAYLLRHDSVQADPSATIEARGDTLVWDGREVRYLSVKDPSDLPWSDMQIDVVIEASGLFTKHDDAAKHLKAGAKHVVVTAPSKGAELTVCLGVNEDEFDPERHKVVSCASCTTNCLVPVAKVLDDAFGIEYGFLTTVHAYTSSQKMVDAPSKKWRRGRAAAVSIVPTTTGAATATTQILKNLEGKMDGIALRVPVASGSIIDFVVHTKEPVTVESVNAALTKAAGNERLKGILGTSEEELVSADIIGSTYSGLVDLTSTTVIGDHAAKVLAWYDNEWGYARRVADFAVYAAQHIETRQPAGAEA